MKDTTTDKEQIVKGVLSLAVLSVLEQKEQYGVELLSSLEKTPFKTQAGTLYPLLNKLHKSGLISHRWQTSDYGPARKYYRVSAKGKVRLHELRQYWQEVTNIIKGA